MNKTLIAVALFLAAGLGIVLWVKHYQDAAMQKQTRFLMDTLCSIQIPGTREVAPFIERSFRRIEKIDTTYNVHNPRSPLYVFNTKNTVLIDNEISALVGKALRISEASVGCFDITVYPLLAAWGFYSGDYRKPDSAEIRDVLTRIGYENLFLRGDTLSKRNLAVTIDLGGIAKGYALQAAVDELKKNGIRSGLIDLGGDIYALGTYKGRPWKIGIRNPRGEGLIGVLEASDVSVVTSGDYERFFEIEGTRYHHILDPKNGYPARAMASVTVVCDDPVSADAWSTALFVMEPGTALRTAEAISNLEACIITAEGEVLSTSGLRKSMTIHQKGFDDEA